MNEEENEQQEGPQLEKPALLGMFLEPRKQFERLRDNPKILVPFIIVAILTVIGVFLMLSQVDVLDVLGDDPQFANMEEEELMFTTIFTQIIFVITGIVGPAFAILISSLVYFIVAKIVKSEVTFKQLFSMNTFIYIISVVGMIINALSFFAIANPDPDIYSTSLNSIVRAEGTLGALFTAIEIFSIWNIIITALGLQIVAKFSKGLSWGLVIGIFVVLTGFSMATAGVAEMIGAL